MRASVITIVALIAVTTILVLDAREATAKDLPYPSGESIQQLEGLRTVLVVPKAGAEDETFSLIVVLHGLGGTATGMASGFVPWTQDGYMVCAPKSKGRGWTPDDIARVLRIAARLKRELPIDPAKVHVVGFSNGGWNLTPLAFDDDLHPCSATWIAAFDGK